MRRITQVLWGLSVAFLATPGQAVEGVWPDDPPLPVFKPAMPPVLAAAEMLRLEFLPLGPSPSSVGLTAKGATLVVVPAPTPAAEAAPSVVDPPIPVPKPDEAVASAASEMLRVELLPPLTSGVPLAEVEASAAAGTPSAAQPFSAPPPTSSFSYSVSYSVASNALRLAVPQSGEVSIVPSFALIGLDVADPNLIRMSAPHEPRIAPAPGIGAMMQLGDITLDAKFNQPLRAVESRSAPDTRLLEDRSNFGVDMRLKF
ncbi:MAG TPA: hypothetical protein VJ487_03035 [Alphaproteobacteria bacterium]|nr:hypothetical protein [Alphaproteobacteria bacterium]